MDRNGLEGEESRTDRRATVWRCLSNRERRREKERWSQGHLRVTLAPSAFSSFSSSLAKDHHSAQAADKDVLCAFRRKQSVSQQQPGCFAPVDSVRVCECRLSVSEHAAEGCTCSYLMSSGPRYNLKKKQHIFHFHKQFFLVFLSLVLGFLAP